MYTNNHITHQFPQPTRPMGFFPITDQQINLDGIHQFLQQPSLSSGMFSGEERVTTSTAATTSGEGEVLVDELIMILLECLERVDIKGKELLMRKMFSEIEKQEEVEKFIIGRLTHSNVKAISELLETYDESRVNFHNTLMRELDVDPTANKDLDGSGEELTQKLERFKVKTIRLDGVVK